MKQMLIRDIDNTCVIFVSTISCFYSFLIYSSIGTQYLQMISYGKLVCQHSVDFCVFNCI